jgi:hypothetical protein
MLFHLKLNFVAWSIGNSQINICNNYKLIIVTRTKVSQLYKFPLLFFFPGCLCNFLLGCEMLMQLFVRLRFVLLERASGTHVQCILWLGVFEAYNIIMHINQDIKQISHKRTWRSIWNMLKLIKLDIKELDQVFGACYFKGWDPWQLFILILIIILKSQLLIKHLNAMILQWFRFLIEFSELISTI